MEERVFGVLVVVVRRGESGGCDWEKCLFERDSIVFFFFVFVVNTQDWWEWDRG